MSLFRRLLATLRPQAPIPSDIREVILVYLAKELQLREFQSLEAERHNIAGVKYLGPGASGSPELSELVSASRRLSQAAGELVARHSQLGPVPDEASQFYFAWHTTYLAYQQWASALASACEAYRAGFTPNFGIVQQLQAAEQKARQRALKEEGKLFNRLKLTGEQLRQLMVEARAAAEVENGQPPQT